MESTLDHVLAQRDALISACTATTDIFYRLSTLATTRLPDYIAHAHTFTRIWNEEHECIHAGMSDLSDLRASYTGFLDAYDGLILEVARQKATREAVQKVLRDARGKLDKLFEDDVRSREAFRVDQGDYLPSDIWPGLARGPMRVGFVRISGDKLEAERQLAGEVSLRKEADAGEGQVDYAEGDAKAAKNVPKTAAAVDDTADSIPELPRQVVEKALVRRRGRAKGAAI
jgi:autophagy-related protein 17